MSLANIIIDQVILITGGAQKDRAFGSLIQNEFSWDMFSANLESVFYNHYLSCDLVTRVLACTVNCFMRKSVCLTKTMSGAVSSAPPPLRLSIHN